MQYEASNTSLAKVLYAAVLWRILEEMEKINNMDWHVP